VINGGVEIVDEKQNEPALPIYNLNVPGPDKTNRQTKAIDAFALNEWIEEKKRETSMFLADPKQISDGTSFHFVQAQVFQQQWIEFDMMIKESIGIIDPATSDESDESDEVPEIKEPRPVKKQEPNQPSSDFFEEKPEEPGDGEIIL